MITTIQVTQDDIKNGKPCKSADCPLALAISRYIKSDCTVSVGANMVHMFSSNTNGHRYDNPMILPGRARKFREDVDKGKAWLQEPFLFELNIPEQFLACPN